jgi:ribosomal protein S27AE
MREMVEDDEMHEPFTPSPTCAKCQSGVVALAYCDRQHVGRERIAEVGRQFPEHLDITCDRCGYVWTMRTADAPVCGVKPEGNPLASDCNYEPGHGGDHSWKSWRFLVS